MGEGGDSLRLALEARERVRIVGGARRQDLQGDVAIEPGVPRPVDLAHPARAQKRGDLVATKELAGREGHRTAILLYG